MEKKRKPAPSQRPQPARHSHGEEPPPAGSTYVFRGRTIAIAPSREDRAARVKAQERVAGVLRIDGYEVPYEETDEGVHSHEMMFQRFSSPEELAEELVRQWGTSLPTRSAMPPHEHGSEPGHGSPHRKRPTARAK
jgi:hypothetical protein